MLQRAALRRLALVLVMSGWGGLLTACGAQAGPTVASIAPSDAAATSTSVALLNPTPARAAPTCPGAALPTLVPARAAPTSTEIASPTVQRAVPTAMAPVIGQASPPSARDLPAEVRAAVATNWGATTYHLEEDVTQAGVHTTTSGDLDIAQQKLRTTTIRAGHAILEIIAGNVLFASTDGGRTFTRPDNPVQDTVGVVGTILKALRNADAHSNLHAADPPVEAIDGMPAQHVMSASSGGAFEIWYTTGATRTILQIKTTGDGVISIYRFSHFNEHLDIQAPVTP